MKNGFLALFERWREDAHYQQQADGELLGKYLDVRDEAALRALLARHLGHLFALCHGATGNREQAEDAVQETILVLVRWGRGLRRRQAVGAWLRQTARRVCWRMTRRERRRQRAEQEKAATPAREQGPGEPEPDERCRLLAEALAALPDRYGLPLSLRYLQNQSLEQIAAVLRLPVPTVKTRLTRGKKALRQKLLSRGVSAGVLGSLLTGAARALPVGLTAAVMHKAGQVVPASRLGAGALLAALALVGHGRWVAVGLLLVGLGAGGTAWSLRVPEAPAPVLALPVVRETTEERNRRLLRDEVVPRLTEALTPMLIGGGEMQFLEATVEGSLVRCVAEGRHKLGFTSRLRLQYRTLNGGILVELDPYNTGKWQRVDPERPIRILTETLGERGTIKLQPAEQTVAAFRAIPVEMPPWVAPEAIARGRISPEARDAVQPYVGVWYFQGNRQSVPMLLYVNGQGNLCTATPLGETYAVEIRLRPGEAPQILHGEEVYRLSQEGRRLDLWPGWWWER